MAHVGGAVALALMSSAATANARTTKKARTVVTTTTKAKAPTTSLVAKQPAPKPNIILVIADDMGVDASPCYPIGNEKPIAPTISRLCEQGVVFDNVWVNPTCSPTRASMLTGKYGYRTGVGAVGQGAQVESGV